MVLGLVLVDDSASMATRDVRRQAATPRPWPTWKLLAARGRRVKLSVATFSSAAAERGASSRRAGHRAHATSRRRRGARGSAIHRSIGWCRSPTAATARPRPAAARRRPPGPRHQASVRLYGSASRRPTPASPPSRNGNVIRLGEEIVIRGQPQRRTRGAAKQTVTLKENGKDVKTADGVAGQGRPLRGPAPAQDKGQHTYTRRTGR